jgi:phosphoribosylanthranilate isomerase
MRRVETMTRIKVCGLTNLQDARWAWQCGADLLGFIFVPSSPRYVPPAKVAGITEALRAEGCEARFVGVFVNELSACLKKTVQTCSLHLAQLHGDESPEYVRRLGVPVIVARRVRERVPWEELAPYEAWAYLLDSYDPDRRGGTGHTWDWDLLQMDVDVEASKRLIVAGGLAPDNVANIVQEAQPWGVDVSSGVECRPGRKDQDKVKRFIDCVRKVDETTCKKSER